MKFWNIRIKSKKKRRKESPEKIGAGTNAIVNLCRKSMRGKEGISHRQGANFTTGESDLSLAMCGEFGSENGEITSPDTIYRAFFLVPVARTNGI